MIARVLSKREDARLALILTAVAAIGLGLVVLEDATKIGAITAGPTPAMYAFVAYLIALAGIGPWVGWTLRGDSVQVRAEAAKVHAGGTTVDAADVSALSVVEAARGRSVAIARGKDLMFVEVERAEDAARIAAALGGERGELPLRRASRSLALPQLIVTLMSLAAAPLYFRVATDLVADHASPIHDAKAFYGLGGVVAAALALALIVARRLVPGQAIAVRRGAWDTHVALHRSKKAGDAPEVLPVRAGALERGEEGVGAWLTRLDAIPADAHAYRGDALKKDVLWDTLGDTGAPVDARMAAARVLSRRYGEGAGSLVRVVEDPEVRVRIEAALEVEHEEAERRIENLGPLFRAR